MSLSKDDVNDAAMAGLSSGEDEVGEGVDVIVAH